MNNTAFTMDAMLADAVKGWQLADRLEAPTEVDSYLTLDSLADSVLLARTTPGMSRACQNVYTHRGRRPVNTPPGARAESGGQLAHLAASQERTVDFLQV